MMAGEAISCAVLYMCISALLWTVGHIRSPHTVYTVLCQTLSSPEASQKKINAIFCNNAIASTILHLSFYAGYAAIRHTVERMAQPHQLLDRKSLKYGWIAFSWRSIIQQYMLQRHQHFIPEPLFRPHIAVRAITIAYTYDWCIACSGGRSGWW